MYQGSARLKAQARVSSSELELLAATFQALGDPSRLSVVWEIRNGEVSVGEIAKRSGLSQPSVSHHLRTLRNLRLVRLRKEGKTIFYALDDIHIDHLLAKGLDHVREILE